MADSERHKPGKFQPSENTAGSGGKNLRIIAAALLIVVLLGAIIAAILIMNKPKEIAVADSGFRAVTVADKQPIKYSKAEAGKNLKIYFDINCSHCAVTEGILRETIDTEVRAGRLALEIYPLAFLGKTSKAAAADLACAAESGFGYEFYQLLWENPRRDWENLVAVADLGSRANEAAANSGNMDNFRSCVQDEKYYHWAEELTEASKADIEGTPTLILDGRQLEIGEYESAAAFKETLTK